MPLTNVHRSLLFRGVESPGLPQPQCVVRTAVETFPLSRLASSEEMKEAAWMQMTSCER